MKLSRLSDRQLKRLLARGEVRFAEDIKKKLRDAFFGIHDYTNSVDYTKYMHWYFKHKDEVKKENPELYKKMEKQMDSHRA